MTPEQARYIRKGIDAYSYQQKVLRRLLCMKGKLLDDEFDRLFRGREWRRPSISRFGIGGDSLILGDIFGGEWSQWLHLLQCLVALEEVSVSEEDSHTVYRLLSKSRES